MTAVAQSDVVYTADVARAAREFARENGVQVGTRGRLSVEAFAKFFKANPATARDLAARYGVEVSKRGRLAAEDAEKVALLIR